MIGIQPTTIDLLVQNVDYDSTPEVWKTPVQPLTPILLLYPITESNSYPLYVKQRRYHYADRALWKFMKSNHVLIFFRDTLNHQTSSTSF